MKGREGRRLWIGRRLQTERNYLSNQKYYPKETLLRREDLKTHSFFYPKIYVNIIATHVYALKSIYRLTIQPLSRLVRSLPHLLPV